MSYKPYEHYKDSGVQWIGKVPKHWELKRYHQYLNSEMKSK